MNTNPNSFPDSATISKPVLVGWLVGKGGRLPFDATVQDVFDHLNRLAELAKKGRQAETQPGGASALANTANAMPEIDYSTLNPHEAGQLFYNYAAEIARNTGCTEDVARLRVKFEKPELFKRMNAPVVVAPLRSSKDVALENIGIPPLPVFGPQMKALLALPGDADAQECEAAWRATKGQTTPPDFKAIWKNLFALMSGGMSSEYAGSGRADRPTAGAVELRMNQRYPALAAKI